MGASKFCIRILRLSDKFYSFFAHCRFLKKLRVIVIVIEIEIEIVAITVMMSVKIDLWMEMMNEMEHW